MKFSEESNLHGFNHIANKSYTIAERFGWLVLTLLSTYFAFSICINQVARFINDPFIISAEVDYKNWNYNFVAFTICDGYSNDNFIDEYYKRLENVTSIDYSSKVYRDYHHYMKIIASLNAENMHLIDDFENTQLFKNLSGDELLSMALNQKFSPTPSDSIFRYVVTEAGICVSTTNLFKYFKAYPNDSDEDPNASMKNQICKSRHACYISSEYRNLPNRTLYNYNRAKIYFHGLNDTLNMKRSTQSEWYSVTGYLRFIVNANEVITSERAKMFGIETRKCRFDTETTLDRSNPLRFYTKNLCLMECSVDAAIKICGCRPFFYKLGPGPVCNVTGMICLSKNHWNEYRKNCSCLPQCNAIDYSYSRSIYPQNFMQISVRQFVKGRRLKRDLKYGLYYLVVMVGGSASLFLGCSFISIAELIYFAVKHVRQVYFRHGN